MIEATYRLFAERGYGVPLTAIAEEAGVAVQTLYFTFHNKATLLQHALQFAVIGDELPLGPHEREWFQAVVAETDQRRALAIVIENTLPIFHRTAPLTGIFLSGEPDATPIWQHSEQLRNDGFRVMLQALASKGGLREGVTEDRALDMIFSLMSPQFYHSMVVGRGWTADEWGSWILDLVAHAIFPPPRD
jgi:AcrR family transcriptional regulator